MKGMCFLHRRRRHPKWSVICSDGRFATHIQQWLDRCDLVWLARVRAHDFVFAHPLTLAVDVVARGDDDDDDAVTAISGRVVSFYQDAPQQPMVSSGTSGASVVESSSSGDGGGDGCRRNDVSTTTFHALRM